MKREQRKTPLRGPLARLRRGFCRKSPPSDRWYARVRTPDLYGPVVAEELRYRAFTRNAAFRLFCTMSQTRFTRKPVVNDDLSVDVLYHKVWGARRRRKRLTDTGSIC